LLDPRFVKRAGDRILQGTQRRRYGHWPDPGALGRPEIRVVKDQPWGRTQASGSPGRRHGQVMLGRQRIRELVQRERRGVAEDALLLAPEPERHQVFVLERGRELREAEDAAPGPIDAGGPQIELQELRRDACLAGLREREVAGLRGGSLEERVPVGSTAICGAARHHKQIIYFYLRAMDQLPQNQHEHKNRWDLRASNPSYLDRVYRDACDARAQFAGANEITFGTDIYQFAKYEVGQVAERTELLTILKEEEPKFRFGAGGRIFACHKVGTRADDDIRTSLPRARGAASMTALQELSSRLPSPFSPSGPAG
jgi:hypothetical protein